MSRLFFLNVFIYIWVECITKFNFNNPTQFFFNTMINVIRQ